MATGALLLPPAYVQFDAAMDRDTLVTDGKVLSFTETDAGAITVGLPYAMNPQELDGVVLHSFADDFYNRIYVIPSIVNIGGAATTQIREIVLWSAYRTDVTLDQIELTGFTGMSLLDIAEDDTFRPLQFRRFRLSVNPAGPREIDGLAEFAFDTGYVGRLVVIGVRGELAVFEPSWTSPLSESIEYKTTILSSITNHEQRVAERVEPRVNFSYPILASTVRDAKLREFFRSKGHERTATILWSHYVRVDQTDPGESVVTTPFIPSWIQPGIVIAAFDPALGKHSTPILGQILSTNSVDGTITLDTGFAFALPQGAKLYRYGPVWFAQGQQIDSILRNVSGANLNMLVDPLGFVFSDLTDVEPEESFLGLPVFNTRHNWASPISVGYVRDQDTLDYGQGVIQRETNADHTTETFQLDFLGLDYEKAEAIRDMFTRARGRQGEFWRTSYVEDMAVQVAPLVGEVTLTLLGSEIGELYQFDETKRAIEVTMVGGEIRRYTIESITPDLNNDSTDVVLVQDWIDAGGAGAVASVSWLYRCRFASDLLQIDWLADERAQVRTNILTLPVEPVEV